jgi:hypothetical protein
VLFKRKCISCGKREPIANTETIPSMGGDVKLRRCSDCYVEKKASDEARKVESERQVKIERQERSKQKYYEKLKREVEIRELEIKAEELGIDCEELKN